LDRIVLERGVVEVTALFTSTVPAIAASNSEAVKCDVRMIDPTFNFLSLTALARFRSGNAIFAVY
jgi:hypothetical protein